ncbi:MAG: MG2 domain-containing protein [Bacteroidales bacterium]|nr:MG2 domain-containing protein [Bacteroidales bacterium]
MKKIFFCFLLIFGMFSSLFSQQNPKDIHQLLVSYEKIFQQYDNGYDTVYLAINQEIKNSQGQPVNQAVWHSCMAQLLHSYYEQNQYEILDRTPIVGEINPDFNTWDLQTLVQQIVFHYLSSIKQTEILQNIPITEYAALLDTTISIEYRPTLYDFLAFRALDYLGNTIPKLPVPMKPFDINNPVYWKDNADFTQIAITSSDSLSFSFLSLKIMQELTHFHLNDKDKRALLDVTIRRYNYLNSLTTLKEASRWTLTAFEQLEQTYRDLTGYEMITNALGNYYHNRGKQYDKNSHPEYKNDWVTAVEWYQKTIATAPKSIEANRAQIAIENLAKLNIAIEASAIMPAQQANLMTLHHQNCQHLYLRIIPITKEEDAQYYPSNDKYYDLLIKKKAVLEESFTFTEKNDYRTQSAHFQLPALEPGYYSILVSNSPFTAKKISGFCAFNIMVSHINAEYRIVEEKKEIEFFVFNRKSGKPLSNAKINIEIHKNTTKNVKTTSIGCDKNGRCTYSYTLNDNEYIAAAVICGNDYFPIFSHKRFYDSYSKQEQTQNSTYIFTDRNLYRPGQTVYFKGIVISKKSKDGNTIDQQVVKNQNITIKLWDENNQIIAEQKDLKTNEFGSFSGHFVLPNSGLTGEYHLSVGKNSQYFSVEEYKRPTFEITFDKAAEEFKLGDSVNIVGNVKAYAGYGLDHALVNYRVVKSTSFPWRYFWYMSTPRREEIAQGETFTDAEGKFKIDFFAAQDLENQHFNPLYQFEVLVDVTDITGETHSASTTINISEIGLFIQAQIPEQLDKNDTSNFIVNLTNLAGEPQKGSIHYRISKLKVPQNYRYACPTADHYLSDSVALQKALPYLDFNNENDKQNWESLKIVQEGDFITAEPHRFSIHHLSSFENGYYKIHFTTFDKNHNEITEDKYVLIYDEESKKCTAYEAIDLRSKHTNTAEIGETIPIVLGTYLKNASILFEIFSNDSLIESKWINLDQENAYFNYKVTEKDLGTIIFHAFVAQNNNQYEKSLTFTVPYSHQKIDFDFITFRDKTTPGSQEQYQIRLKNKKGDKVAAELLCSMYDASLDILNEPHSINKIINLWVKKTYPYFFSNGQIYYSHSYFNQLSTDKCYPYPIRPYPILRWDINQYRNRRLLQKCYTAAPAMGANLSMDMAFEEASDEIPACVFMTENTALSLREYQQDNESISQKSSKISENSIRTNFNETAFFFPHLQTDKDGNILISFTMPDALTRWKLQGFAHNEDLMSGYFEKIVTTQKPLMVAPNMPRFFREGDTLVLSAKVVNMDNLKQSGSVKITFLNPLDGEKIELTTSGDERDFSVEAGQSQEVHFAIVVPTNIGAITYRIEAKNNQTPSFADGEENTIPVLTNRILITESLPLHISDKGSKTFNFNKLQESFAASNSTISTQSLTLEFTPNPIWYAIQSMPYLMEYPYECNEQVFSRYYANSLAANLINKHPKIKAVFDAWLNKDVDAFCSQLDKNQELKSVILAETPWVLEAQNENVRKQNIALLFDFNRMVKEEKSAIDKLEKSQNSDGGWSWFAGGVSSSYITEHIVAGCGHLQALGIKYGLSEASMNKAIRFIDQKAKENYEKWYKKDKNSCNISDIHYLYARSYFKQKIAVSCEEAYNYYYSNLKKNWKKQSIYGQAMTALICFRNGDVNLASEIIAKIKSMAQYDEEMGMWWKKEGYGYFWYEAPIERQALLIEAFNTITHDQQSVEKMQLWLLKQKQTQNWPTTKSTTEAIYALLLNNNQLENNNGVRLSVGDWQYTEGEGTMNAEAGSGYVKKVWKGNEVDENMATVQIEKHSNGPAWGSLYWQYLKNIDKVTSSDDKNLVISKKLYKVEFNERGEVLTPLTENSPLKVGDKVRVRTEIRSDRDMEYVHLKDMRAAAFEPVNVLSGYKYQGGLWYYEATGDAATNFFIDYLPKGTYVFEYTLFATMAGTYSNGITSIQCMYAPEFTSHSKGERVKIK